MAEPSKIVVEESNQDTVGCRERLQKQQTRKDSVVQDRSKVQLIGIDFGRTMVYGPWKGGGLR